MGASIFKTYLPMMLYTTLMLSAADINFKPQDDRLFKDDLAKVEPHGASATFVSSNSHASLELASRVNFASKLNINMRLVTHSNPYNSGFAQMLASLKDERLADASGEYFSYTDRFDYDHNLWGQVLGGAAGFYSGGYSALGGLSMGYDRLFGHVLLGGYATYAYTYSWLDSYRGYPNLKNSKDSSNFELGGYLRIYADVHQIDLILSQTFGFNNLYFEGYTPNKDLVFGNLTTNLTASYGYIFPINPNSGFYIKPLADLNFLYQFNTQVNSNNQVAVFEEARHAMVANLGAFVELRKYINEKKFFYLTPGIQQDVFVYNSSGQIYFAQSMPNKITYNIDNRYRTYLTLMGGGEIGLRENLSISFGLGARLSWDRYFLNANIGIKYMFNTK